MTAEAATNDLTTQIEEARKAGDWEKHADLWEQRRVASVEADESMLKVEEAAAEIPADLAQRGWKLCPLKGGTFGYERPATEDDAFAIQDTDDEGDTWYVFASTLDEARRVDAEQADFDN